MRINNIHSTVVLSIALIMNISVIGQNYVQDMSKIKECYKNKPVSFTISYKYFPYDSVKVATDSMKGYCCEDGNNYYYKIVSARDEYEYVNNDKYCVVVDHASKAIALKKSTTQSQQIWNVNTIDSLVNSSSVKVSYKEAGNNQGEYILNLKSGNWSKIKVVFSKSNYILEKIQMYSNAKGKIYGQSYNKPSVSISFSGYKQKPAEKNLFKESNYFTDGSNGIVLADAYKGYKLKNYLNQHP